MFDWLEAFACEGAGSVPDGFFEGFAGDEGVDQGAVESFGYTSQGCQFNGSFGFRLLHSCDGRLLDAEASRQLSGRHTQGFADSFDPTADRGSVAGGGADVLESGIQISSALGCQRGLVHSLWPINSYSLIDHNLFLAPLSIAYDLSTQVWDLPLDLQVSRGPWAVSYRFLAGTAR